MIKNNTQLIKKLANDLGFISCGISKAERLESEVSHFEKWLKNNYHASMYYMENHFEKRLDPTLLLEGAKSVISLAYNYFPSQQQRTDGYKISKYAYGEDYHKVIKEHLTNILTRMYEEIGDFKARVFTDSAPILERAWAVKSGLGWQGKNANLITKKVGSFFFLAEIICDLDFEYDHPITAHCGSCTRCIDACPTNAIVADKIIDGNKCISYLTIELKDEIPKGNSLEDWIFGCDICQDVCPWNRHAKPHTEALFKPHEKLLTYDKAEWKDLTEEIYQEIFKKSAVKRAKYSGLMRNIMYNV